MADMFTSLELLGRGKLFEPDKKEREGAEAEAALLFEKTYECPCCGKEFKAKTVRSGKTKLISTGSDLRPRYQQLDSLKYDAIACPHCGYAALSRFFMDLTSIQRKYVQDNITPNFKGIKEERIPGIYTYEDALNRHKLALLGTMVRRSLASEQAYTCLKIAWLLRGKEENLAEEEGKEAARTQLKEKEAELIDTSYNGFSQAFSREEFPMCGMDEYTTELLMADLARRSGKKEESARWISTILVARECNDRIKNKAREVKELLDAE